MAAVAMQIPAFDDLSGNWLCLDFTHTLTERYSSQPYADLRQPGQSPQAL